MPSPSKEKNILKLFFNYPTKHWQFKELKKDSEISDAKLAKWLKKFIKLNLIEKIKTIKKMPHYIANYNSPNYQNTKKIFAIEEIHKSGLLNHLLSLKSKVIIIFGSIIRWDWYDQSDIDLFIFGDSKDFKPVNFEKKLHRNIQIFHIKNKKDLKRYNNELLSNIIQGNFIKGEIKSLGLIKNA